MQDMLDSLIKNMLKSSSGNPSAPWAKFPLWLLIL